MPNAEQVDLLKKGYEVWNKWRGEHPASEINLSKADLSGMDLRKTYLRGADLRDAALCRTNFREANLLEANLRGANLNGANLYQSDLRKAYLRGVNLVNADIRDANLSRCTLINVNLCGANLSGCNIFGISAWDIKTNRNTNQTDLIITHRSKPAVTVDNIEVAQFIYLILNNSKIRDVIDTMTSKVVLLLGRFSQSKKKFLDNLRNELRLIDYIPIMFDFNKPASRDTKETILTLASMSRFVIADISEPRSIPLELATIIPNLPSVPIQPIIKNGEEPWGMYDSIKHYPWVLDLAVYEENEDVQSIVSKSILPAQKRIKDLYGAKE